MKVLFLATRLPVPPWRGDQVRAFHHLRLLAPRHHITLMVLALERPAPQDVTATEALGVRVDIRSVGRVAAVGALVRAVVDRRPLQVLLYARAWLARAIARQLSADPVDVVHAQLVRTASYAPIGRLPVVVDFVDALSLNLARRGSLERGPLAHIARAEAARLQGFERQLAASRARCLVATETDREALGSPRVQVVPNGVDAVAFPFREETRPHADILFAGNLGYFPNVDAAVWLARDIFPRVQHLVPQARLRLVGARPHHRVRRLARQPGVEVTGPVADMAAELARAAVALVPMRSGSGVQNKVLEAMAAGTPVVTTPGCATAVGARDGEHLLTASDAPGLARATARLLLDPPAGRALARAARQLVVQECTWERSAAGVEHAWDQAVRDG